jgi:hypothetical protein
MLWLRVFRATLDITFRMDSRLKCEEVSVIGNEKQL